MNKEELKKRIEEVLASSSLKIECFNGVIKVYKNTYFGHALAMTIYDDLIDFDDVKYELK